MTSSIEVFARAFNRMHRVENPPVDLTCDFCSGPISAGDRVTTYVSEGELGGYAESYPGTNLYAHRTYCQECDRHHIIYPHKGTSELLLEATVQSDGTHTDWALRDSSSDDHGEPWDGQRAFEFVFGEDIDMIARQLALRQESFGHEDVVDVIRRGGIDLREVFDENGTIIAPKAKQQHIQQQVFNRLLDHGTETDDEAYDRLQDEGRPGAFTCPECSAQADYWDGVDHEPDCSSATVSDE